MNFTSAVRRTAPAVTLLAVLAGCSASPQQGAAPTGAALLPGEGPVTDSPTPAASGPASGSGSGSAAAKPFKPSDWPTEPVPERLRKVPDPVAVVMKAGYTGEAYLKRLAAAWGVTMNEREKIDFPGKAPSWHQVGYRRGDGGTLAVTATWTIGGDLEVASCTANLSVPKAAEFLADCARLDYPGSDPTATSDWVTTTWPQVHSVFADGRNGAVDSPLRISGPVGVLQQEGDKSSISGDYRMVYLFGAGQG
ncbi:hypothetical protein ABT095_22485 [Kitasatospora sp. NPDC002227]|uniref:hypothetical protein n=1 Tax=Kitasatospora sp. NPDC002227 TaxID=3154773 RepID=UPI00331B33D1